MRTHAAASFSAAAMLVHHSPPSASFKRPLLASAGHSSTAPGVVANVPVPARRRTRTTDHQSILHKDEDEDDWHGVRHVRRRTVSTSSHAPLVGAASDHDDHGEPLDEDNPRGEPHAYTTLWFAPLLPYHLRKRLPALPLYTRPQCPDHLQFNPHISTGYRAGYTHSKALWSICATHNETGNIWSHLAFVPVFAMGALVAPSLLNLANVPQHEHGAASQLHLAAYLASATICLSASTLFHTHYCTTRAAYLKFGCADYAGISLLMSSGAALLAHAALLQHSALVRGAALAACLPLALAGVVGPMFHIWHTSAFRARRTGVYAGAAVVASLTPAAALVWDAGFGATSPGSGGDAWWARFGWIPLLLFLFLGVTCYVKKIPESLLPGRFDTWGHSHQIWHLCVVIAVSVHARYALGVLAWRAGAGPASADQGMGGAGP